MTPVGGALFIFYTLFVVFGLLGSVGSLLMQLRVIPPIPALEKLRVVIVGGFVWSAFLMLFFSVFVKLFELGFVWLSFWGWLGYLAHLTAVVGLLLELWLQLRGPAAPTPRIDLHL